MMELPDFSAARVLVVGDVMLDRYWHGGTERISPEAPVPVVRVEREEGRPGGAANVALNVAALGGGVVLIGVTGDDEQARILEKQLAEAGVDCRFERAEWFPTITKLRVISRHQQLIRLDFEDGFPGFDPGLLLAEYESLLPTVDLVVISDYGKGTIQDIGYLIRQAKGAGKPVLVDPKHKDFGRYKGATLITPNLTELEAASGPIAGDEQLVERGAAVIHEFGLDALLVTRGEQGMTLFQKDQAPRHLPTHAREVFDVTGAGDTVIAAIATGLAVGMPLESVTRLANLAAGIVVGKLGTAVATVDEIKWAIHEHQAQHQGVLSEEQLLLAVQAARSRGETVVFTNGCFDILHAGHVSYLEQASRLGDRLVVAVNVDETVRLLKGKGRPVNSLERRMAVMAALGCVDWVVSFSEETPERLICLLKPDLLVKGGDNDPDQIPGAQCVREAGGEVKVMDYLENCSTTDTIESIRGGEDSV